MPSLPAQSLVQRLAGRLRFPRLLALTAALFVLDLLLPDPVPFLDEILLGLATLVLSSLRSRRDATTAPRRLD